MANTLKFKRGLLAGLPTAAAGEPLFTTDTFDLYIGNGTTNTRFQKYIASGATTQILRGDGSLYTFPLAISSPSAGQVLKYNGTSWVNDSDSGITGSLTTNYLPKATGATTLGNSLAYSSASQFGFLLGGQLAFYINGNYSFAVNGVDVPYFGLASGIETGGSGNASLMVSGYDNIKFYQNNTERMRITSLGNLHIGTFTSDSGEKLQVTGTMKVTGAATIAGITSTSQILASYSSTATTIDNNSHLKLVNTGTSTLNQRVDIVMRWEDGTYNGTGGISMIRESATARRGSLVFQPIDASGNNLQAMLLNSSGNLGLAVTPSAWASLKAFQINSQSSLSADGTSTQLSTNAFFDGAWKYIQTDEATNYYQLNGQHVWRNAISGSANAAITWNQAMTLDASGNLGVGTASPSNRLHISATAGNSHARWTEGSTTIGFVGGANGIISGITGYMAVRAESGLILSGQANAINLAIHPTTGNIIINNGTSDSGEKLQVNGTAKITGITTFGSTGGSGLRVYGASGTNQWDMYLNGANIRFSDNTGTGSFVVDRPATFSSSVTANTSFNGYQGGVHNLLIDWSASSQVTTLTNTELFFGTNAQRRMTITNTGNLLINSTTDSGEKLQVTGTAKITGASTFGGYITQTSSEARLTLNRTGGTTFGAGVLYQTSGTTNWIVGTGQTTVGTDYQIYNNSLGSGALAIGYTNNFVGIGINVPTERLHVSGNAIVTGNLTVDTNTLFVDATNNRVGVGTITPDTTFRVAGTANSTQAIFGSVDGRGLAISTSVISGTNEAGVIFNARSSVSSGTLIFQTDGTQRVQIDSTGLIINGGNALEFINSAANAVSAIRPTGGGTSVMSTNSNGLHIAVGTEAAGDLILASNNTERIRLSSSGWFSHTNATNPSSSVTDSYVQYSADVTAGNAAPHFRTENGAVIKLYQETTAVGNAIFNQGGGNAVLDDSTFAGYTLRQIVKALQNQGILA
jgi:hypothetical protein